MNRTNEAEFEKFAEIFKALANKTRLQILTGVLENECNVKEIVEKLGVPQSTVSQHLSIMRNKGIIKGRREGAKMCYRVTDELVRMILILIQKKIAFPKRKSP